MGTRGRKSSANNLSIVATVGDERQPAPETLLPEARPIWDEIIRSRQGGYFDGCGFLLEALCTAIHFERAYAERLAELPPQSKLATEVGQSLRAQTNLVSSLATRLRLTPRSFLDRRSAPKIVPSIRRPWEVPSEPAE